MQRSVRELIGQKNELRDLPVISENSSLKHALEALEIYGAGVLLVLRGRKLIGVFTEWDFARWSLGRSLGDLNRISVREVMVGEVVYVTPEYRLEECLAVMAGSRVRHLPVLEAGDLIALVSMRHITEALIEAKEFLISELTKYITGSSTTNPPARGGPPPRLVTGRDSASA